jgi:hypothetical protein
MMIPGEFTHQFVTRFKGLRCRSCSTIHCRVGTPSQPRCLDRIV